MRYPGLDPTDFADSEILKRKFESRNLKRPWPRVFCEYLFSGPKHDQTDTAPTIESNPNSVWLEQYNLARAHDARKVVTLLLSLSWWHAAACVDIRSAKVIARDISFRRGLESASQTTLGDPPISKWEPFFGEHSA